MDSLADKRLMNAIAIFQFWTRELCRYERRKPKVLVSGS